MILIKISFDQDGINWGALYAPLRVSYYSALDVIASARESRVGVVASEHLI